eukprot:CAMPEP_0174259194 /NCGR_PEP_ID=MMETSP0439-20130205/8057_1 /TAXON_ID=0 /ORGANISM="Stereomyxa ramosa, Strain Chinc5" /LENGTH=33 /DNA_ID= /DNA_START= /DNA_END= /DNA_ORIENTATION=
MVSTQAFGLESVRARPGPSTSAQRSMRGTSLPR